MRHYKWIAYLVTLLFATGLTTSAQEEPSIFILRDDMLLTLNVEGVQQETANLEPLSLPITDFSDSAQGYIASVDITADGSQLYALLHQGRLSAQLPFPTRTQLIEIDPSAATSMVIYERPGIFAFVLSPNAERMIVGYYDADYYFSTRHSCILDLQTRVCTLTPHQISSNPGDWIDSDRYLVASQSDYMLHVLNVETGQDRALPLPPEWILNAAAPIPNTQMIIVGADQREISGQSESSFLTISIDTLEVRELPYVTPSNGYYPVVSSWSFSPDNQYMLYGDTHKALVDFTTGRLVRELDTVVNFGWTDDHTLIIQGSVSLGSGPEIAEIDAASGDVRQLAFGDAASGIMLIP